MADTVQRLTRQARAQDEAPPLAARAWNPSDRLVAGLFVLPTLLLLTAMFAFPLLWLFGLSFTRFSAIRPAGPIWVGLENYARLLGDADTWAVFVSTARFVALAVSIELGLGFGLALLVSRALFARGLLTTVLMLPVMLSPALAASFWLLLFEPQRGVFNFYLAAAGGSRIDWLGDPRIASLALVLVDVWQWTPFMLLISLAGLAAVPRYLYEAAAVDGASGWFSFTQVTLPYVRPLLLVGITFRAVDALRTFEYHLVSTGYQQSTPTLAGTLYRLAFYTWETGRSAALACVVLVLTLALTSLFVRTLTRATR